MAYQVNTLLEYFQRYFKKFFVKEWHGWLKVIKFYRFFGIICICAIITLIAYIKPLPPNTVYLATGQEGTSYKLIADSFKTFLKDNGINLVLVSTKGLGEGLKNLNDDYSEVSASFLTAGSATGKDFSNLVSLGSVQYAPIWIFYRGETIKTNDPFEYFMTKKLAIGPAENVTNKIFRELYELNHSTPKTIGFYELPFVQAADKLQEGSLDAIFMIDNYQSETVQRLLLDKNIKIMNFPLADAYLKKLPFLHKLIISRGSINLETVNPPEDIYILASTTTLLVEKNTHPAIQWGYLLAAKEISSQTNNFFSSPGYFPKNLDFSFPLSPIAKRFYDQGTPAIFGYLPLWIASLIENVWIYILAFVALIYPAFQLIGSARKYPSDHLMFKMFTNLRELDEEIPNARTKEDINVILNALDVYEKQIYLIWLFNGNARFYFSLKNAYANIKQDTLAKAQLIDSKSSQFSELT